MSAAKLSPEIWIAILFEITEDGWGRLPSLLNRTLGNVALVSPTLRALAQPLMFEFTDFSLGENDMEDDAEVERRMNGIGRWIDNNPERKIESWIKRFRVRGPVESHDWTRSASLLKTICAFLKRLTRVRAIYLSGVLLTTDMYGIIHHLPCLRSFTYACEGDDETGGDSGVPESNSVTDPFGVEHLNISYSYFGRSTGRLLARVVKLALAPKLKTLFAGGAYPEMAIALYNMAGPAFRNLSTLRLDGYFDADVSKFCLFLASCESVTKLTLDYHNDDESAVPTGFEGADLHLAKSVLPSLKLLNGPLVYANALVPGRPVGDIHIACQIDEGSQPAPLEVLSGLTGGTVPVRRLVIKNSMWGSTTLKAIGLLFPVLETLQMESRDCDESGLFQNIMDGIASLENIKILRFGTRWDRLNQLPETANKPDYTMAFEHASSSLRMFWVENACVWERNGTGVWKVGSAEYYFWNMILSWRSDGRYDCYFGEL